MNNETGCIISFKDLSPFSLKKHKQKSMRFKSFHYFSSLLVYTVFSYRKFECMSVKAISSDTEPLVRRYYQCCHWI